MGNHRQGRKTMTEVQCTCPECGHEFDQDIEPSDYTNDRD